jgi:subtilisin family serine protease
MAGPHVAGLVALLWSANPDLIGDIDLTERIIIETAQVAYPQPGETCNLDQSVQTPNNVYGYGIVDALAAVEAALEIKQ